ncbi:MAG: SH3 domain-containing protein [Lachnospiraceae bacterium]|nr:SH3 domain-containing protein [Lachnospiraceae bacterium]
MIKDRLKVIRDFAVKNSKIAFPIIIIVAVAVTVTLALQAGNADELEEPLASLESISVEDSQEESTEEVSQETPLERNTEGELYTLIATYFNAYATGDVETIRSISSYLTDTEAIRISEMAKYVDSYPLIEIYTKPGPKENSYLAYVYHHMTLVGFEDQIVPGMKTFYVCTAEDGSLYLNTDEVVSEEELDYIREVNLQDDVVELNNNTNVECSEIYLENADLFYYVQELVADVKKTTGEILAAQQSEEEEAQESQQESEESNGEEQAQEAEVPQPTSGTATTTVNVRASDSEQAEKIGKVSGGTEVQIVEQQLNGWTHIVFEGKDGYIKSEFLSVAEAADASQIIGQVTATTNINVRLAPSQEASKLGVLTGGDTVDLLERADGWCKISYNGQIGYVKEEYVQ